MDRKSVRRLAASFVLIALCATASDACAQKHDEDKFRQIRSMEDGEWNFSPSYYYYYTHKNYSGGYSTGFLGVNKRFREDKSNVKRVGPSRAAQIPLEVLTMKHLDNQIDSIQPLVIEEGIRSAERMVDIIYPQYKEDFEALGASITESIKYSMEFSSVGGVAEACSKLQMEYDAICSEIEYMHQQGPGYEIEPTKRQIAYEDARVRMTELAYACSKFAMYVSTF